MKCNYVFRTAAKKVFFVVSRLLRGGGGVRTGPRRKENFFGARKKSLKNVSTKFEAGSLKKELFIAASLTF